MRIANDDLIAGILNRNKLVTGNGNRWTRERVTSLRSYHCIPVWRPAADGVEPWLNLTRAAKLLGISQKTLRLAAEGGEIDAVHPLADSPWVFSRVDLHGSAAQRVVARVRHGVRPRPLTPISKTYSLQQHRKMGILMRDCRSFDESEDITLGVSPRRVLTVMDEFGFESVEEALHRGIVEAVGLAAH